MKNCKLNLSCFILSFILLLISKQAATVTAYPGPVQYTQPDGTVITIYLKGDEKVRWAETTDHFTLVRNSAGAWEYGMMSGNNDLVPSGLLAHDPALRSASELSLLQTTQPGLTFSASQVALMKSMWDQQGAKATTAFTPTGTKHLVMILIGFTDLAFTKTNTDFVNLMNQVGYNQGTAIGSVRDYYLENSYNQFTVLTTVAGPYTASNTMAYYGANDAYGDDVRPRELVTEAVNLANPDVNYADFDNDGDGTVDGVYVIYAGYGEEAGASANAIWAHAWTISPVVKDGKTISRYSCSCELRGTSGTTITAIGVICHEFGHVCGAADYYDTDYGTNGQYDGTGKWDMMANGSWNGGGDIPAHHNAYNKTVVYGWITATLLSGSQSVSLRDITYFKDVVKYTTTTTNEYFLCENRQASGFNAALPGHGMIIYHVDGSYITNHTALNNINAGSHQGMFPMSAISTTASGIMLSSASNINTSGCPWPGTGNKTSFTDATTPRSKSWANSNTSKPLSSITENTATGVVSFCYISCAVSDQPGSLTATAAGNNRINLSWTKNQNNDNVLVAYSTVNAFGLPVNGTVYQPGSTLSGGGIICYNGSGSAFSLAGLNPSTTYYVQAWSVLPGTTYSARSIGASASTSCQAINALPFNESFSGTSIPNNCWSQVDHQGNGQIWQFGAITDYVPYNPVLSGSYAYLNSDAYGSGNSQNASLITPSFDLSLYSNISLGFRHYFRAYGSSQGTVSYSLNNGSSWTLIQTFTTSANPAVFSQLITALAGQSQVKFKWTFTGSYAWYWAIDDISVTGTPSLLQWAGTIDNDWQQPYNWKSTTVPLITDDIYLTATGIDNFPVLNQSLTRCHNLSISGGAVLTVNPGKALTVTGTATLDGSGCLVIKSDASGQATFIDHGISGSGTASVEHYLTGSQNGGVPNGRFYYLGSPVGTAQSGVYNALGANKLWRWSEPSNTYTEIVDNTTDLTAGIGYAARITANGIFSYSGRPNSGTLTITGLSRTGTSNSTRGYHLLSNCYPSGLNWDSAERVNISETMWYRTVNGSNLMVFDTYNAISGIGTDNNGGGTVTGFIRPMQAFWVRVGQDGATGSLSFDNSMRSHEMSGPKTGSSPQNMIRVYAASGDNRDETILLFSSQATDGYNNWDSEKMFANISGLPEVFTTIPGAGEMVINSQSPLTDVRDIPLGFKCTQAGNYSISANTSSFNPSTAVILEDHQTGILTNLNENAYDFSSSPVNSTSRFTLHLAPAGISGTLVYDNPAKTPLANVTLQLSDPANPGTPPLTSTTTDSSGVFRFVNISPGIYTLRALTAQQPGGFNATDARAVIRYFTGSLQLQGLRLKAADVNANGFVNAGDALTIQKRFVGLINTFPAGDWIFEEKEVTVTQGNTGNVTINGICTGDVDGSY